MTFESSGEITLPCGELRTGCVTFPSSITLALSRALDVTELLVVARYQTRQRRENLERVNLLLERTRFLLRLSRERNVVFGRSFEAALRQIDEVGRMLHGWRWQVSGQATPGERGHERNRQPVP